MLRLLQGLSVSTVEEIGLPCLPRQPLASDYTNERAGLEGRQDFCDGMERFRVDKQFGKSVYRS